MLTPNLSFQLFGCGRWTSLESPVKFLLLEEPYWRLQLPCQQVQAQLAQVSSSEDQEMASQETQDDQRHISTFCIPHCVLYLVQPYHSGMPDNGWLEETLCSDPGGCRSGFSFNINPWHPGGLNFNWLKPTDFPPNGPCRASFNPPWRELVAADLFFGNGTSGSFICLTKSPEAPSGYSNKSSSGGLETSSSTTSGNGRSLLCGCSAPSGSATSSISCSILENTFAPKRKSHSGGRTALIFLATNLFKLTHFQLESTLEQWVLYQGPDARNMLRLIVSRLGGVSGHS